MEYIGLLSEKINESIIVLEIVEASKRLCGLSKFTFYAISDGLFEVLYKSYSGIGSFFAPKLKDYQLRLAGF